MNGAWIFQIILVLVSALVSASVGYFFGVKQQKKQALGEYITEIVRDIYPALFSEMGLHRLREENPQSSTGKEWDSKRTKNI
jgi:hypothetical protein